MVEPESRATFIAAREACRSQAQAIIRDITVKAHLGSDIGVIILGEIPLQWEVDDPITKGTDIILSSDIVSFSAALPRVTQEDYHLSTAELAADTVDYEEIKDAVGFLRMTADALPQMIQDDQGRHIEAGPNTSMDVQKIDTVEGLEPLQFRLAQLEAYIEQTSDQQLRNKVKSTLSMADLLNYVRKHSQG